MTGPYKLGYSVEGTVTAGVLYGPSGWKGEHIYISNDDAAVDQVCTLNMRAGRVVITIEAGEGFDEALAVDTVSFSQAIAMRLWIFGNPPETPYGPKGEAKSV